MNTIKALVQATALYFDAVSDSAKLDAQLLLAHAIDKNITYLHTWPEYTLTAEQLCVFQRLVARRIDGEPIAYIVGLKEFWSLPLMVSPATLIPRPDTEILVEWVLANHSHQPQTIPATPFSCLDLGTGTGAIALALASELPNGQFDAVDFNPDAVALAQKNADNLGFSSVSVYQSDWFSNIDSTKRFAVIVSNPPYIDEHDQHLSQGDVRFEPKSALVADANGLADITHIAEQARLYLTEQGSLYIEHGFEQGQAVRDILQRLGYQNVTTKQDYGGNDRITMGCWPVIAGIAVNRGTK